MIRVQPTRDDMAACSLCGVRNYTSSIPNYSGKQEPQPLLDLHLGRTDGCAFTGHVCGGCAGELRGALRIGASAIAGVVPR